MWLQTQDTTTYALITSQTKGNQNNSCSSLVPWWKTPWGWQQSFIRTQKNTSASLRQSLLSCWKWWASVPFLKEIRKEAFKYLSLALREFNQLLIGCHLDVSLSLHSVEKLPKLQTQHVVSCHTEINNRSSLQTGTNYMCSAYPLMRTKAAALPGFKHKTKHTNNVHGGCQTVWLSPPSLLTVWRVQLNHIN